MPVCMLHGLERSSEGVLHRSLTLNICDGGRVQDECRSLMTYFLTYIIIRPILYLQMAQGTRLNSAILF
jgi:hypothetical protein